jgi:hypothetical protein
VIAVSASVTAGLDWVVKVGVEIASVIAHAQLAIDGKCHLGLTFTNDDSKEYAPLEMTATARAEIRVAVTAFGYTVGDIGADARPSIRFEGGVHVSFTRSPEVDGKLTLTECTAAAWFYWKKHRKRVETVLWKEQLLWSGKLPAEHLAAESSAAAR